MIGHNRPPKEPVKIIKKDKDRYGRIVGIVILHDGKNLNQELVRLGLAWWYKQYAKGDKVLQGLEQAARKAKRGLWQDAKPVAPWVWRRKR